MSDTFWCIEVFRSENRVELFCFFFQRVARGFQTRDETVAIENPNSNFRFRIQRPRDCSIRDFRKKKNEKNPNLIYYIVSIFRYAAAERRTVKAAVRCLCVRARMKENAEQAEFSVCIL